MEIFLEQQPTLGYQSIGTADHGSNLELSYKHMRLFS